MIQVIKTVTADDPDILNGTDLENIPGGLGQLDIFSASDAADTVMTITAPAQETPVRNQLIQEKTNSLISLQDDLPTSIPTIGGKYTIAVDITAAAVVKIIAIWRTAAEVLAESGMG